MLHVLALPVMVASITAGILALSKRRTLTNRYRWSLTAAALAAVAVGLWAALGAVASTTVWALTLAANLVAVLQRRNALRQETEQVRARAEHHAEKTRAEAAAALTADDRLWLTRHQQLAGGDAARD